MRKRYDPDTCTQWGVLRVGQSKGVTQTFLTPTPVAMVTKICDFQHKIGHNSACIRDRSPSRGLGDVYKRQPGRGF